ncbi:MAG: DUF3105 domain-containing protein [Candidatus Dormibacteria bacterium]
MAKKNTVKQQRLDARAEQIRAQVEAERRRTYIIIAVFAVLIIGGAGILYFFTANPFNIGVTQATGKALGGPSAVPDEGNKHVTRPARVTYKHQPPSSGNHYNEGMPTAPRPWGPNQTELLPEEFVHNLEHGGIALVYKCSGSQCDDYYAQSQALFAAVPKEPKFNEVKFLSTPYASMTPRFALLAWDHEQDFSGFPSTSDVTAFYNQFVDSAQAPEGQSTP